VAAESSRPAQRPQGTRGRQWSSVPSTAPAARSRGRPQSSPRVNVRDSMDVGDEIRRRQTVLSNTRTLPDGTRCARGRAASAAREVAASRGRTCAPSRRGAQLHSSPSVICPAGNRERRQRRTAVIESCQQQRDDERLKDLSANTTSDAAQLAEDRETSG
jgi:hypothetical protein